MPPLMLCSRESVLESPGFLYALCDWCLRFPWEDIPCTFCVRIVEGDISWSSPRSFIGNRSSSNAWYEIDHFEYTFCLAGAYIHGKKSRKEPCIGRDVCLDKVRNVDIITSTRPIRCIIVIPEDIHLFSYAVGDIENEWEKIIRCSLWAFSYFSGRMGAYRIEVSKGDNWPPVRVR